MKLMIYVNDEGITDDTFKEGDIFQVYNNEWEPGEKEKQRWLVIGMPEYSGGDQNELVASEYSVGPGNEAVIRRMRKYRVDYATKLTPEELTAAKDRNATVEPIIGRFAITDIVRK